MGKKLPVTLRTMSDVETAYVGAMIEAEGGFYVKSRNKTGGEAWIAQCNNTEVEIVSAILRATRVGGICLAHHGPGRPVWRWQVQAMENVRELARRVSPFSVKAQQFLARIG